MKGKTGVRLLKTAVWVLALLPAGGLVRGVLTGELGADPVETLLHRTGTSGLILLLATLAVTPARRLTGWNPVIRIRRLLGLFSFFYALCHVGVYLVLDQGLAFGYVLEDVAERPYVTAGAAAFVILLALAATSTRGWIRRLGRRWRTLHRWVYGAGGLAVLHFIWGAKADLREPLTYALVFGALMLFRLPRPDVGGFGRVPSKIGRALKERGPSGPSGTAGDGRAGRLARDPRPSLDSS